VVIPVAVACDYFFSYVGFGDNTITKGMDSAKQLGVLQMYAVLLGMQLMTHRIVRYLLKRQIYAIRARVELEPKKRVRALVESPRNMIYPDANKRMSILDTILSWDPQAHNRAYWNKNFSFFMCMVVFTVFSVLYFSSKLKHELCALNKNC